MFQLVFLSKTNYPPPPKTNMTMKTQPFEDVRAIYKNGDFPPGPTSFFWWLTSYSTSTFPGHQVDPYLKMLSYQAPPTGGKTTSFVGGFGKDGPCVCRVFVGGHPWQTIVWYAYICSNWSKLCVFDDDDDDDDDDDASLKAWGWMRWPCRCRCPSILYII